MSSLAIEFKEIVETLQEDNQDLREIIAEQDAKLQRAMYAIHQLHGELYNQRTQAYMIKLDYALLHGKEEPEKPKENINIWPTTCQGDKHEDRITKLEETIKKMQEQILYLEKKMKSN